MRRVGPCSSWAADGMVHKLGRTTFGLQDAFASFDRMSGSVAEMLSCKLGTMTHCVLNRGNLVAQGHGDDCAVLGTRREVRAFREDLSKHFLLKLRGRLWGRLAVAALCSSSSRVHGLVWHPVVLALPDPLGLEAVAPSVAYSATPTSCWAETPTTRRCRLAQTRSA